ncbi:MAG: hypothetical protein EAZ57_05855 [Cytophagales bacterium]|nr:MAG: hypothetical protein EAZ67_06760 [Cytophagales bacterium]TAF60875.1 MAG: hypothetical protein EAZ57_05855 [Cytophagales bacterium]
MNAVLKYAVVCLITLCILRVGERALDSHEAQYDSSKSYLRSSHPFNAPASSRFFWVEAQEEILEEKEEESHSGFSPHELTAHVLPADIFANFRISALCGLFLCKKSVKYGVCNAFVGERPEFYILYQNLRF